MTKRNLGLILLMTVTFIVSVKADIAPPSGYTRVSVNLIVETKEDVSDYRFYLDFFGDKKDVEIKSKGITNLPPMGGGARYSSVTLWAVSKKDAKQEPIELLKHQFSKEVPSSDSQNIPSGVYRIERDGNTLKATKISDDKVNQNKERALDFTFYGVYKGLTVFGYIVFIGIPLIFIVLGIWLFRKRRRRLE